ncbi:major Facilitator Superfamily transporter, partial [Vibrio parahaemolyticus VP-48]
HVCVWSYCSRNLWRHHGRLEQLLI